MREHRMTTELGCDNLQAFCEPPLRACGWEAVAPAAAAPPTTPGTLWCVLSGLSQQLHLILAVPVLLIVLRKVGVIKGLGAAEICAIGVLMHMPALVSPQIGVTLSVALNVTLILHLQEVQDRRAGSSNGASMPPSPSPTTPLAAATSAAPAAAAPLQISAPTASPGAASVASTSLYAVGGPKSPKRAPQLPKLTLEEEATLRSGAMMMKTIAVASGNEGLAAQRVDAPAELVWATILDFGEWPRMVDDVVATQVYEKSGHVIKVKVTIGIGFLRIHTHVHHELDQVAGTLTWRLDESKSSDLLANTGYWIVRPGSPDSSTCTVFYSCAVQLRSWAPGWLDRYIAREGLPRALGWLKREAEQRHSPLASSRMSRSLSSPNLTEHDESPRPRGTATSAAPSAAQSGAHGSPRPKAPPPSAGFACSRAIWQGHGHAMKPAQGSAASGAQGRATGGHRRSRSEFGY